jgi:hypothetical protein
MRVNSSDSSLMSTRGRVARQLIGNSGAELVAEVADAAVARSRAYGTSRGRDSVKRLSELKNGYRSEQCVIIGNGPSLRDTDLKSLEGRYTFGLNRIYLMFDELGFATTFHVVVNRLVIEQCTSDLEAVQATQFVSWAGKDFLSPGHPAVYLQDRRGPRFCRDVGLGVWQGSTVTFVAMQLAYHMGFRDVVLVGIDHRFADQGPANQVVTSTGDDPNHFDPNYFGKGFRWQLPDLETSEVAYGLARTAFEHAGGRIVDATVNGACQVFQKSALKEALRS